MNRQTFRLIIFVSLAHALVHVFELALPSVEQMIGEEFTADKAQTGALGMVWRFPFGAGALLAGWLVDRWGSKRMLMIYLLGCAATAALSAYARTFSTLYLAMFAMGCFASIYHPAGLSAISKATSAKDRGAALGWHGIFGSAGIASAPFIAGVLFGSTSMGWRDYYLILIIPAVVLTVVLAFFMQNDSRSAKATPGSDVLADAQELLGQSGRGYFHLVSIGAMQGFIYAAFLHFLPRYLGEANVQPDWMTEESFRNWMAAVVLICGIFGQALAGRLSRPGHLEKLLAVILWSNVLPLVLMATANGYWRIVGACWMAFVLFMTQPAYNSLIAQYVPPQRRSVGYGFNNFISFGLGSLGAEFAGIMESDWATYGSLAIIAAVAGVSSLWLPKTLAGQASDSERP